MRRYLWHVPPGLHVWVVLLEQTAGFTSEVARDAYATAVSLLVTRKYLCTFNLVPWYLGLLQQE